MSPPIPFTATSGDSFGLPTIPGSPSDTPRSLVSSVSSLGMATPVSSAVAARQQQYRSSSPPPSSTQLQRQLQLRDSQQIMAGPAVLTVAFVDEDDGGANDQDGRGGGDDLDGDDDDAGSVSTVGASSVATGTGSSLRTGDGASERIQVGGRTARC